MVVAGVLDARERPPDNEAVEPLSEVTEALAIVALPRVVGPDTVRFVMVVVAKAVEPAKVTAPDT